MELVNKLFKAVRTMNLPYGNDNINSKEFELYKVNEILERDYEKIGFQDAVYEPSQAIIELKLDRFRLLLLKEYQIIIEKRNERLTKLMRLYDSTKSIDPLLSDKLYTDIEIIKYDIDSLKNEYQLIENRGGKFKIIENSYKIGYTTGVITYKNSVIIN